MNSPVFLLCPTTSGSPPVLSISLSDHSFSALASSFACTLAHPRPLWRFMFFSKRAFNALSSSSRCSGDSSLLSLLMLFILLYYRMEPILKAYVYEATEIRVDLRKAQPLHVGVG